MDMLSRGILRYGYAAVLAFALAGCASLPSLSSDKTASSSPDSTSPGVFGRLLSFNKASPSVPADTAPETTSKKEEDIDCPEIAVQDGTSAVRIYAGTSQANDAVRYQFSLGELARECRAEGKDLKIKVGISGLVLSGPAGSSGNFTVPVRVVVRRDADQKPLVSELYRIDASLKADESQTSFVFVTPILSVPHTRPDEDQVYTIFIGFDSAAKVEKPSKTRTSPKH
jgi:hypothetical protein